MTEPGGRPFSGWLLDETDRAAMLARWPPRYAEVVAHHVTLAFGPVTRELPGETKGEVIGVADDGQGVEALVVRIGGRTERPDGSTFHITWSLGPGRRAVESNAVIARAGWTPLAEPLRVRLTPRLFRGG